MREIQVCGEMCLPASSRLRRDRASRKYLVSSDFVSDDTLDADRIGNSVGDEEAVQVSVAGMIHRHPLRREQLQQSNDSSIGIPLGVEARHAIADKRFERRGILARDDVAHVKPHVAYSHDCLARQLHSEPRAEHLSWISEHLTRVERKGERREDRHEACKWILLNTEPSRYLSPTFIRVHPDNSTKNPLEHLAPCPRS